VMSVLLGPSMDSSNGVVFSSDPATPAIGLARHRCWVVGKTGSATYANGVFTVQGAATISGRLRGRLPLRVSADKAQRNYRRQGNWRHHWSTTQELMMRETLDADAANVSASGSVGSTNASMY